MDNFDENDENILVDYIHICGPDVLTKQYNTKEILGLPEDSHEMKVLKAVNEKYRTMRKEIRDYIKNEDEGETLNNKLKIEKRLGIK